MCLIYLIFLLNGVLLDSNLYSMKELKVKQSFILAKFEAKTVTSCYMTCVKTPLCKTVAFNDQNLNGGGERKGECVLLNSLPEEEQQNCLKTKNLMSNDGFAKIKKESTSDDEGIEMTVISNKDTLVHGGYGPWSPFSACTNSCDGGTKIRYRTCDQPAPSNGGNDCRTLGNSTNIEVCNTQSCPVIKTLLGPRGASIMDGYLIQKLDRLPREFMVKFEFWPHTPYTKGYILHITTDASVEGNKPKHIPSVYFHGNFYITFEVDNEFQEIESLKRHDELEWHQVEVEQKRLGDQFYFSVKIDEETIITNITNNAAKDYENIKVYAAYNEPAKGHIRNIVIEW